jgi:hypothetical protein
LSIKLILKFLGFLLAFLWLLLGVLGQFYLLIVIVSGYGIDNVLYGRGLLEYLFDSYFFPDFHNRFFEYLWYYVLSIPLMLYLIIMMKKNKIFYLFLPFISLETYIIIASGIRFILLPKI